LVFIVSAHKNPVTAVAPNPSVERYVLIVEDDNYIAPLHAATCGTNRLRYTTSHYAWSTTNGLNWPGAVLQLRHTVVLSGIGAPVSPEVAVSQAAYIEVPLLSELPAYVPFSRFVNLLDRLESAGIPPRIERSQWGASMSGALGGQLFSSLRFLELIDGAGQPLPALAELVPKEKRRSALANLLRRRYGGIFDAADPGHAKRGHLDQAFTAAFTVGGDTRRKAVTFFLKASDYAGVQLSKDVDLRASPRRRSGRGPRNGIAQRLPGANYSHSDSDGWSEHGTDAAQNGQYARTLVLGTHGSITLAIRVNLLTLNDEYRTKLLRLIDAFRDLDSGGSAVVPNGD
jgi:hypothetical protein